MFALCGWALIPLFHAWRLCFLVPAALLGAGVLMLMWRAKAYPSGA